MGERSSSRLRAAFREIGQVAKTDHSCLSAASPEVIAYAPAHSPQSTSACSSTVCVAFSCLSGG